MEKPKDLTETKSISPEIFKELPYILFDGCNVLTDQTEKAVFLYGALGVISGMLPKVWGTYNGMTVYPNIYVWILSPYGSGKGSLILVKELGMVVHRDKKQVTQSHRTEHEIELETYQTALKVWKKNKLGDPPTKPQEPDQNLLYIPINISEAGFIELLNANNESGIVFEPEADTMTENQKKEWGIGSSELRKAFHHESFNSYRKTNKEFVEVERPKLSVILSSTFDQLPLLIPSVENGLFSRFLFFSLTPDPTFKNVFEPEKSNYQPTFEALGERMAAVYNDFQNDETGFQFRFTEIQQSDFLNFFQELKTDIQQNITTDLDGTVNRLGLQFFRIAMILTTLRKYESGEIEPIMECSEKDYELTKKIILPLCHNAIEIYSKLPPPHQFNNKHLDKAENVKLAIEMYNNGQTFRQISQKIFNNTNHTSTIFRWIRNQ